MSTAMLHRKMGDLQMAIEEWHMPNDMVAIWDWGVCPRCNKTVEREGNVIDIQECGSCSEEVILVQPIFMPKGCLLVIE